LGNTDKHIFSQELPLALQPKPRDSTQSCEQYQLLLNNINLNQF